MKIKVLDLQKKLFDGDALKVVVPSVEGELCLLPHHISILTKIVKGHIQIFRPDGDRPLSIEIVTDGICYFSRDQATFILKQ